MAPTAEITAARAFDFKEAWFTAISNRPLAPRQVDVVDRLISDVAELSVRLREDLLMAGLTTIADALMLTGLELQALLGSKQYAEFANWAEGHGFHVATSVLEQDDGGTFWIVEDAAFELGVTGFSGGVQFFTRVLSLSTSGALFATLDFTDDDRVRFESAGESWQRFAMDDAAIVGPGGTAVPEPASVLLLISGLLGVAAAATGRLRST